MNEVLEEFSKIGIIPVLALQDAADAKPLAKALIDGGLPCAEITFRTDAAQESIRIMAESFPEMLVGAGTVITIEQVDAAVGAGAKFIVSPGLNPRIVKYCVEKQIPIIPGCANPSDMELAMELGLDAVKFFPAEANGGLPAIQAMAAPYYKMKFMPTGGVNESNVNRYLSFPKIIACGGSWMAKETLIKAKDWAGITAQTQNAISNMLGFTIKHIGINAENESAAMEESQTYASLFGTDVKVGNSSVFAGPWIEVMKKPGRGTHGHIAVGTNSIERAVYHLERRGFCFDESSKVFGEDGRLKVVYFKEEMAGFAVHLVQNKSEKQEGL